MKFSANAARSLVASQSFPRSISKSSHMPDVEASTKYPEVTSPKENAKGDLENEATKLFVPPDGEVQVSRLLHRRIALSSMRVVEGMTRERVV